MSGEEQQQQQQQQACNQENMDTTDAASAGGAGGGGGAAGGGHAAAEDDRKLFVGGLPQDAKEQDISDYFGQFGEIESVNLKTDPTTGRSRGFAFVVFSTTEGVENANGAAHEIKGKKVAVKKAQAKQGKIYVGKLRPELSDEEIKSFFAQYGSIAQVEQPFDKIKNERKNFCFITFDKEETAKQLLKEGAVNVKGHELDIKKVTPKPAGQMQMFGGRGGGRGGAGGGGGGQQYGGYGGQPWNYGGYGDGGYGWGGYGDPYGGYGAAAAWGGYGGGQWMGYPPNAGGKTPRGGPRGGAGGGGGAAAARGRGVGGAGRGQRQKPY